MKKVTRAAPDRAAQRKSEGLHLLAILAESEGRMDAAHALATWADATAPFVPYSDAEIRALQAKSGAR